MLGRVLVFCLLLSILFSHGAEATRGKTPVVTAPIAPTSIASAPGSAAPLSASGGVIASQLFARQASKPILLVYDNSRQSSGPVFKQFLSENGYSFESFDVCPFASADCGFVNQPLPRSLLMNYTNGIVIIYSTGYYYPYNQTTATRDLSDFLNAGGSLLIVNNWIGRELDNESFEPTLDLTLTATPETREFAYNYLGLRYSSRNPAPDEEGYANGMSQVSGSVGGVGVSGNITAGYSLNKNFVLGSDVLRPWGGNALLTYANPASPQGNAGVQKNFDFNSITLPFDLVGLPRSVFDATIAAAISELGKRPVNRAPTVRLEPLKIAAAVDVHGMRLNDVLAGLPYRFSVRATNHGQVTVNNLSVDMVDWGDGTALKNAGIIYTLDPGAIATFKFPYNPYNHSANKVFASPGAYNVSLKFTDSTGEINFTDTTLLTVKPPNLLAVFRLCKPSNTNLGFGYERRRNRSEIAVELGNANLTKFIYSRTVRKLPRGAIALSFRAPSREMFFIEQTPRTIYYLQNRRASRAKIYVYVADAQYAAYVPGGRCDTGRQPTTEGFMKGLETYVRGAAPAIAAAVESRDEPEGEEVGQVPPRT